MRSPEPFHVKDVGDLTIHVLLTIQLNDAPSQTVLIGVFCVALYSSLQPVVACRTCLPNDPDPDVAAPLLLIQHDLFDHQSDDLLTVRGCCRCGVPKPRQIFTEPQYLLSVALGDHDGLLATPRVVFMFDLFRAP